MERVGPLVPAGGDGSEALRCRFGNNSFSGEEQARISALLQQSLGREMISTRPGPGGRPVAYMASSNAIEIANHIFNFNGWSSSVAVVNLEYKDEDKNGRISVGVTAQVRVTLKDGTFHEDIGWGSSSAQPTKAAAYENAYKEAATDGMKRALRLFGNALGNSIYDKDHVNDVLAKAKLKRPPRMDLLNGIPAPAPAPPRLQITLPPNALDSAPLTTNPVLCIEQGPPPAKRARFDSGDQGYVPDFAQSSSSHTNLQPPPHSSHANHYPPARPPPRPPARPLHRTRTRCPSTAPRPPTASRARRWPLGARGR
eukprot:gnl/Spiro4/7418_TR3881_c0_g2_i1.p1 gnl/Spiro4/7418_TR3881_c0_g2~~gnl/Spiro4/7418_TR3881_c0_g2_i1.p1  ORF type:complete len:312 (-),score=48.42 gnl/Spiro4/7418_TR3881_c0_g2_i1:245-1180(-)